MGTGPLYIGMKKPQPLWGRKLRVTLRTIEVKTEW